MTHLLSGIENGVVDVVFFYQPPKGATFLTCFAGGSGYVPMVPRQQLFYVCAFKIGDQILFGRTEAGWRLSRIAFCY
jgi:hypothetical protein